MISVIIPTYNEADVLGNCLRSLSGQSVKDFEVVVVDDGSNDKTMSVLSELRVKNYELRILRQNHKGAGAARNFGAKKACGDILVFADADMTFDKKFLEKLVDPIEKYVEGLSSGSRGTFSKAEFVANWDNVWARCWSVNENWQEGRRHPKNYPDHQFVFRAILKSEFDRVGGFTPGGYDDDWSLGRKLGYEAVNAPGAIFYHKNPSSLSEAFNHAKWVGKRKHKLGVFGDLVALVRASFPVSLCVGLYKSLVILDFKFLVFKLVYDFGIFVGILEKLALGKTTK
jgi:glycosyltransferase involved in cell wall biosynthesis